MKVQIAYFSGTGSTRYVAESFQREMELKNHIVYMHQIGKDSELYDYDLLLICFVVHACNALSPGFCKFVLIKEGFDFQKILKDSQPEPDFDFNEETRGLLWLGVRRYLLDCV